MKQFMIVHRHALSLDYLYLAMKSAYQMTQNSAVKMIITYFKKWQNSIVE